MCFLMSAAVRASTSSRSSDAFTSSPISASVDSTSADTSSVGPVTLICMDASAESIFCSIIAVSFRVHSRSFWERQNSNFRQIAVALSVVKPVTHHKLVRNWKADVIRLHRGQSAFGLIQKDSDTQVLRFSLLQDS